MRKEWQFALLTMQITEIKNAIEAIIFASGEPIELSRLALAVKSNDDVVRKLIAELRDRYTGGVCLVELNGCYQFCTNHLYADYIREAIMIKRNTQLSNAAMEVLAIISYNQPVSKGFIEQVRGVESGYIVNSLVEKGLIEEAGRIDVPGHPLSYRTTTAFLRSFSLTSLKELPPVSLLSNETDDETDELER